MMAPDNDSPPAPAPQGPLDGSPYVAKRLLGRGSMGAVYLCEHRALGTKVVVKVLHADLAGQKDIVERVRIEAQAQAKLRSPHILTCSDFGVNSQGAPYLVTEYLDGRTLKDEIDARGALPVNEAVTFTIELLKGLAVAHKAGIVHRDVKPSNLFVATTEAGRVLKILDFGIAKVLAQRTDDAPAPNLFPTAEGVMVGTPRFCSAEQALARPVDHRSDLYSASLVLYSMLTGRGPFDGKRTMADLLLAQAIEKPAAPSTFAAHVPATLDAVVLKALEKSPDARYASAAEFITALQAVTKESPAEVRSAEVPERPPAQDNDDTERDAEPAPVVETVEPAQRPTSAADDPTFTAGTPARFDAPPPVAPPQLSVAKQAAPVVSPPAPAVSRNTVPLRDTVPLPTPARVEHLLATQPAAPPVIPTTPRRRGLPASGVLAAAIGVAAILLLLYLLLR